MTDQAEIVTKDTSLNSSIKRILEEHQQLFKNISLADPGALVQEIKNANRIFLIGAGRTGFMIKAAAMRLMHLGYQVYVVGETNTPAIGCGDLLIAASGSGTTSSIVRAAETAHQNQAMILAFTTNATSPLAQLAKHTAIIPAAGKQEFNTKVSAQYAGSLFEQSFLILFDGLIHLMWKQGGSAAEELWKRHANME
ncbi:6-phospho-3-hexuloisomerase [Echinicola rosea]|uniref:SIS domain-containing protein n=1 Tax=Echinicola rosea TaxID=1807691 RepID=A0ABQ1V5Y3_9BACT|nr:6-phospho-3-hexuloisomerase [Echinicola rosea]GGF39039.1 hypothetical protein GCM10011339_29500 [Echinicola rosea]